MLLAGLLALAAPCLAQGGFVEVAEEVGVYHVHNDPRLSGGGVALFDANGDGHLDIYLTGGKDRDALFVNDGTGHFAWSDAGLDVTETVQSVGVVTADVDGDGDRDVFLTTGPSRGNRLLRNDGGTFVDISDMAGVAALDGYSSSAAFGDVDLDGDVDLFVTRYIRVPAFHYDADGNVTGFAHECLADVLYLNDGTGRFTDRTTEFGIANAGCGLVAAFSDYDGDTDPDLFVLNDFGAWIEPNSLYENPRIGGAGGVAFVDVGPETGMDLAIYAMGLAPGDYDGDGDLDYYVTNIGRNMLLEHGPSGAFSNAAPALGLENEFVDGGPLQSASWGTALADFDQDGHLDVVMANGYVPAARFIENSRESPDRFYRNRGDGTFEDVSAAVGFDDRSWARGLAIGDLDGDGDLDVVVAVVASVSDPDPNRTPRTVIYRNDLADGHWLRVRPVGTRSNRDGIGARVEAHGGGRRWIREVRAGESYLSQHEGAAHFGLGAVARLDSVVVVWPGGHRDVVRDVAVDRSMEVAESAAVADEPSPQAGGLAIRSAGPNPTRGAFEVAYEAVGPATFVVYDVLGREVARQHAGRDGAGQFRWDGRAGDGHPAAAGVYAYVIRDGDRAVQGTFTRLR
ncbi:FG-GAP-like repeat-containing protein [Rubrivirga sp. IMCC43871]|uniref:FG-GAP-like repeat-containing protein n=1 Tax=Rubrivirga sp. IMCC43871 TaxID=3391575 RepID=UPI00398FE84F